MASNIIKKRLLVLGGNGYVGQNVCHAALQSNAFDVISLNRSGSPSSSPEHLSESLNKVEWRKGDIFDKVAREDAMSEVDAVVSCIGAFGSNEFMQRICGDATIEAIRTAKEKGIKQFGFVSSAQVYEGSNALKMPSSAPMSGYFRGKYNAEQELLQQYAEGQYVILRPGFIYGPRNLGGHTIPLQLVGKPINFVGTQMGPLSSILQCIPFAGKELSSMVPVESVSEAMIAALDNVDVVKAIIGLKEEAEGKNGVILDAEAIRKFQSERAF